MSTALPTPWPPALAVTRRGRGAAPTASGRSPAVMDVGHGAGGTTIEADAMKWLAREPDNPYVAVFAPLMIEDDEELRAQAPALWRTVQEAPVLPTVRDLLSQVLEFWFFERFRGLTAREIWAMLNLVTPIQETRAYQSIFEEGKTEGEAKGKAEGRASTLKRQLARRFGAVPGWAQRRSGASTRRRWRNWMPGSTGSSMPRVCWP